MRACNCVIKVFQLHDFNVLIRYSSRTSTICLVAYGHIIHCFGRC